MKTRRHWKLKKRPAKTQKTQRLWRTPNIQTTSKTWKTQCIFHNNLLNCNQASLHFQHGIKSNIISSGKMGFVSSEPSQHSSSNGCSGAIFYTDVHTVDHQWNYSWSQKMAKYLPFHATKRSNNMQYYWVNRFQCGHCPSYVPL